MSAYQDLIETMRVVQERTGDPWSWMVGLTPDERIAAVAPSTTEPQLEAIVTKIRQRHPELFRPAAPSQPPAGPLSSAGDAAKAIADAEAALAHQNSVTSQLDLQVVSAVLNAHLTAVGGREALNKLQHEIETVVSTRSDLDTPAGARDFQRFLIGKLRDIREVVATASLDDTSKSALMAAWTSLYNASKNGTPEERPPATAAAPATGRADDPQPAATSSLASDPLLDPLLLDDAGLAPIPEPVSAAPMSAPPSSAAGTSPAGGGLPSFGAPSGLPLPSWSGSGTGRDPRGLGDDLFGDASEDGENKRDHHHDLEENQEEDPPREHPEPGMPESLPAGPTTVTLPNGETVTASSPQLAAAIKAAAGGTPIADAFQQQGMTIPAPGTAVSSPVDPTQLAPGDIGVFTDRHALALGRSKALLDGQIQHISTVSGPSFLGWEHPPAPSAAPVTTAPAGTGTPTPTRPATANL
ncbi:hypothetical protein A5634_04980 [Mycobacterium asiaticum]|uniref:DUF4226 domain-containing protein n=1 Tax=Mycobacterium asiaticum TaxID=1790 RepID=A0A1A3NQZ8_MYCAS|nr:DUF4226 domain-containing protein [Mycobacterium asiaticum]OBK23790.1 hypothetical protein A5634_04980 [Mycobacterium asiaticum]